MGNDVSLPNTVKHSENGGNGRIKFGASAMQGWRPTMEDSHAVVPDLDENTSFVGVYDGHGGSLVSKFCAKFLHKEIVGNEAYAGGNLKRSIHTGFLRMDERMQGHEGWKELLLIESEKDGVNPGVISTHGEELSANFQGPNAGCTAVVALIRDDTVIVAGAGDSRCTLSRNGEAHDLSRDHKLELAEERERVRKAGGFCEGDRVNGSLNITRAIGDLEFKRNKSLPPEEQIITAAPEIKEVALSDEDEFLVLACDGIWEVMSSQEVVNFVRDRLKQPENTLSIICEELIEKCLAPVRSARLGCDNMTVVIVQLLRRKGQNMN